MDLNSLSSSSASPFVRGLAMSLLALTVASGCSSEKAIQPVPTPNEAGLYVLATVDSKPLPVVLFSSTSGEELAVSGTIELMGQSRVYSRVLNKRHTFPLQPGRAPLTIGLSGFGVYTMQGTNITFESRGGDNVEALWPRFGVLSGGTITYAIEGHTYRFQKQQ